MTLFISAWSFAILFSLSQISDAQGQALTNGTISWGTSPLIFSKRTTCSGTCETCYGSGSVLCGSNDACFNPTIGETCCAQYDYSCSSGYYCAPGGENMQCCANSLSTDECTQSINNGGGSTGSGSNGNGGLSAGAKAGIGIGVTLLILIIVGLAVFFFFRSRSRRRNRAPAPVSWQMPELSGGQVGPAFSQGAHNGSTGEYDVSQARYNTSHGGYNGTQGGYDNAPAIYNGAQGGYDNAQGGYDATYGNPDMKAQQYGGGPPVAEVYTPGDRLQKAGYTGYVPSHAELADSPPVHASPAVSHNYSSTSEQDRARAAEMYGSHPGQNY